MNKLGAKALGDTRILLDTIRISLQQRTAGNVTIQPQGSQLNVLRDRFEIACQKASAEKCKRACYYATSQICSTSDCKIGMKSHFARECRAHCKEVYRYTDDDDKTDDSDTDIETGDIDDSSSASEIIYNDSRSDIDFEMYLNSTTTPCPPKNKKKGTKSGIDYDSVMSVNTELSKASNYKKPLRKSKMLL